MKKEFRRKLFHIFVCIIAIILLSKNIISLIYLVILLIFGIVISLISKKKKLPIISWFLKKFDREEDILPGQGSLALLLGIILLILIFNEKNVIYASIMILAMGDSFNALIGKQLKKTKHLRKTKHPFSEKYIEGTIAGIIAATLGAMVFVSITEALIASVVAMIVESLELKLGRHLIDDNILIPLIAGGIIMAVRIIV